MGILTSKPERSVNQAQLQPKSIEKECLTCTQAIPTTTAPPAAASSIGESTSKVNDSELSNEEEMIIDTMTTAIQRIGNNGPENGPRDPPTCFIYVSEIMPNKTSELLKELSAHLPIDEDTTSHLRRVQRSKNNNSLNEVIICSKEVWENKKENINIQGFMKEYSLKLKLIEVPSVSPLSRDELHEWNNKYHWSLIYKPGRLHYVPPSRKDLLNIFNNLKYLNHLRKQMSNDQRNKDHVKNLAMFVNPLTNKVLTHAHDTSFRNNENYKNGQIVCLSHAVMNCINKISTINTNNKTNNDDNLMMDEQQYLCTGLDCYVNREPCIMCSMGLIHSRIRRIIYTEENENEIGGISIGKVHSEKLINHKYDAYFIPLSRISNLF